MTAFSMIALVSDFGFLGLGLSSSIVSDPASASDPLARISSTSRAILDLGMALILPRPSSTDGRRHGSTDGDGPSHGTVSSLELICDNTTPVVTKYQQLAPEISNGV